MEGLEPPRLAAPDPKSGAATNYATSGLMVMAVSPVIVGIATPVLPIKNSWKYLYPEKKERKFI
jgi:hypothetical protein